MFARSTTRFPGDPEPEPDTAAVLGAMCDGSDRSSASLFRLTRQVMPTADTVQPGTTALSVVIPSMRGGIVTWSHESVVGHGMGRKIVASNRVLRSGR